ncbi:DUF2716 domain-containing protein [Amycolatopsis sp. TNS106]|uniref:DUF2716 domain-containing protein n=1 Tax=Amycolatopsis sp. TNS106 TaxID=2861750 RepID=UPI001C5820F9|nr:DUF2716 domain-containing protein [Amycolatopsis sp. TNS106]QXV60525.1 hypothetical protein CVV72_28370 [Amycolatopsis sp. TNS106]
MNNAWEAISRVADEPAWYWVYDKLAFWPSTYAHAWPGFREPAPSVAWDLAPGGLDRSSPEFRLGPYAVEQNDVARVALAALKDCVAEDEWVWVLHWQHQSYRFYPHRHAALDPWPVPVFPRTDYHMFLANDFRFGTLGHPWERTLCVYGDKLVPAFEKHGEQIFKSVLRRDGAPAVLAGGPA